MAIEELFESIGGYPGLVLFCAGSGLFIPMPEDVPLLYAGVRASQGEWALPAVLLSGLIGVLTRDLMAWTIGRVMGEVLFERAWVQRWLGLARIERARSMLDERGPMAVLAGRFLIGFRVPMFVMAGALGVPVRSFLLWDLLGLCVAVPLMVGLGFVFGEPIMAGVVFVIDYARIVVPVVAVLGICGLLLRMRMASPPAP